MIFMTLRLIGKEKEGLEMDDIQKKMLLNLSEQVDILNKHVQVIDKQIECLISMNEAQQKMISSLSDAVQAVSAAVLLLNKEED